MDLEYKKTTKKQKKKSCHEKYTRYPTRLKSKREDLISKWRISSHLYISVSLRIRKSPNQGQAKPFHTDPQPEKPLPYTSSVVCINSSNRFKDTAHLLVHATAHTNFASIEYPATNQTQVLKPSTIHHQTNPPQSFQSLTTGHSPDHTSFHSTRTHSEPSPRTLQSKP